MAGRRYSSRLPPGANAALRGALAINDPLKLDGTYVIARDRARAGWLARGLYYVAPHPVAHSAPFTGTASEYPLPVFYGPGIGIGLPGFTIGIQ